MAERWKSATGKNALTISKSRSAISHTSVSGQPDPVDSEYKVKVRIPALVLNSKFIAPRPFVGDKYAARLRTALFVNAGTV
ncbi:hypothetical protein SAMN05192562_101309 [Kosakonia arachidis]|uniref:Uncharacterized protein n=1 Tax=Kosakonia arachidis TaxID=551989 RepID=A0A1I6Y2J1_9ENTR|nr:hypothetical protein SAMN05192562_101309 [Kosakonia arachidis]